MILDNHNFNENSDLSIESQRLLCEMMILENNIELSDDEAYELMSEGLLSERNIVKYDKQTKRKRLAGQAAILIAKEKNDPLYHKLKKVYKQRKMLKDAIQKKYGTKGALRAKQMMQNNKVLRTKDIPIDKNTPAKDA